MKRIFTLCVLVILAGLNGWGQVSVTATAGSLGPTSYTTLSAAFTAINLGTHKGAITIKITANTTEPSTGAVLNNSGAGSAVYTSVLIKPSVIGLSISGSSVTGLIVLNGADYVTIDGSVNNTSNTVCPVSAASRDLTIINTNASTGSAVVWLQTTTGSDAAINNTVQNCTITGSGSTATLIGIGSGSATISAASTGKANNNNSFINNNISKVQYGIFSQGASTGNKNTGTTINQNIINTAAANNVSVGGIYVGYENNITISGNNISNISGANTYAWGISCGLTLFSTATTTGNGVTNATITKNTIGSIRAGNTYGVAGIALASVTSGTNLVANNIISDVFTNGTAGDIGAAVYVGGGAGSTTNIYYNAVTMASTLPGGSFGNFSLAINGNNPVINIKNNIFTNTGNNGTNLNRAIGFAYNSFTNLTSNYNDLFVSGTGAAVIQTGTLSSSGFTSYTTVTGAGSWNAASGKDANSLNILPSFISASNLRLTNANATLNNVGSPVSVTDDIDCTSRSSTPDISVNEFTAAMPPVVNNLILNTPASCNAVSHNVTANITSGTNPIIGVTLSYSYNGVSQSPIAMTGGSPTGTSNWTAAIPVAAPANATVTWSVTATDGTVTSTSVAGNLYQDAPLTGVIVTAAASGPAVCSGGSFNLTAIPNPVGLPVFSEGFEASFPPSGWTFINAGSGNAWVSSTNSHAGSGAMSYNYNSASAANAWGITPGQNLIAGQTYTISFWYEAGSSTFSEKLKVTVGNTNTVAAQTTILWNNNGGASLTNTTYTEGTATYTPSVTGTYYFGFNCYSDADEFILYVDDVSLTSNFSYTWSSFPAGFTSNTQNPVGITETISTTYNVTATYNGCSVTSSPGTTVAIASPLSGTYSVGGGTIAGQAGHYATLTAAVNAYNSICLSGPVTFLLTDAAYNSNETFPITVNANSNANTVNTLTIKPNSGVTATIKGNNASALIRLNGADYVIVDGSNTNGGNTQNLTFNNTNSGNSNVIWINSVASPVDGATHDTIKNCNITGLDYINNVAGIAATGSANLTNAEAPNSFNAVINNVFTRSQEGIAILGCTSSNDNGWYISGNTMGSSVTANQIAFDGVSVSNAQNFSIIANTITGVVVNSSDLVSGIYVYGNVSNGNIYNNKVSNIKNTSTSGYGSAGIYLGASSVSSNLSVYNNFISDIAGYGYSGYAADDNGNGIDIDAGGGYDIYYNTVDLTTNQTSSSGISAALFISSGVTAANSINIKDNVFANDQTSSTRYSVLSSAANTVFASMNYNDYWNKGTNLAYRSGNVSTLTVLKSATGFGTSNNINSQNIQPVFISATDLHLNTSGNTTLDNLGLPISGVTNDIDGDIRNILTPDIGADEFSNCSPAISTWTGGVSTDWNVSGNWCNNTLPTASKSVSIPAGLTNYPIISNADAIAASVTISSGASLSMTGIYKLTLGGNAATFTSNGTFAMGSSDTVIFAGTGTGIVAGTVTFTNVTIKMPVDFGATSVSTVTENFTISSGGSAAGASTHQVTFGSASSLIYNPGSAVTVGNEWARSASPDVSGTGVPFNVTIQNNSTISISDIVTGSWTSNRSVAGTLTISSGSTLNSSSLHDVYVAGNWANSGTYNPNGRTVTLDGTGSQIVSGTTTFYNLTLSNSIDFGTSINTITNTFSNSTGIMNGNASTFIFTGSAGSIIGSNAKNFYNLQVNSGSSTTHLTGGGYIHVSNGFVNNGAFTDTSKYNFYFDKSNAIETLSGTGTTIFGSVTVGGGTLSFPTTLNSGTHSFKITGDSLNFNSNNSSLNSAAIVTFASNSGGCKIKNAKTVTGASANFYDVQVSSGTTTVLDFGNKDSVTSVISNSLTINKNGSVVNNSPKYGNSATLYYNTASVAYTTGYEWNSTATIPGYGTPQNVTIQDGNNVLMSVDEGIGGNLNIANNYALNLNNHTLYSNGSLTGTGALTGSAASGLVIGGSFGTIHFTQGGISNVLQTFTVNAAASVTLSDSLYMTAGTAFGTITADGTINTGDHLVLRSDVNGTARVATSAGTISGNVTVERYIATGTGSAPNHGKSWQLLATPAIGQTIKASWQEGATATNISAAPAPSTGDPKKGYGTMITSDIPGSDAQTSPGFDVVTPKGPTVKIYNYNTNGYDGITNTNLPVYNKHGYFVFVRGDRSVFTSSGTAISTVLRTTGSLFTLASPPPVDTVIAGKFQSIGNPYASAIDMRVVTLSGGVNPFFYVWDPRLGGMYNYGAFQTFSKSGSNYVNLLASPTYGPAGTINNYIQSGQAFLMQATGTNGTVGFTESAKAIGTGTAIFARESSVPGNDTSLRTTLYNVNADGTAGGIVDGVFDEFSVNYCNCVDGFDARKSANTGESLSIITDDTLLVIERRQTIMGNDTIFLYLTGERQQQYQFGFDALNFRSNVEGFVEDTYANTRIPLNLSGHTAMNFTVDNNPASVVPGRLRIVFSPLQILPVTFVSIKAYKNDKNINVEWKVNNEKNIKQYEVEKSLNGTDFLIFTTVKLVDNSSASSTYIITDNKPVKGYNYYRIRSINNDGAINYSTIVKVAISVFKEYINIYPNPVMDGKVYIQFINEAAGKYGLRLLNNIGQVITEKQITREAGTNTELIKPNYSLAHGIYELEVTKPDGSKKYLNVLY